MVTPLLLQLCPFSLAARCASSCSSTTAVAGKNNDSSPPPACAHTRIVQRRKQLRQMMKNPARARARFSPSLLRVQLRATAAAAAAAAGQQVCPSAARHVMPTLSSEALLMCRCAASLVLKFQESWCACALRFGDVVMGRGRGGSDRLRLSRLILYIYW